MYRFDHDSGSNVLHITAEGFWSVPTASAFCVAAVAKGSSIRLRYGDFAIVADARSSQIQSGPVAELLHGLLPKARLISQGPIALIGAGMLSKLQMDRLFSGDGIRSFLDYDQALAWIGDEWIAKRAA